MTREEIKMLTREENNRYMREWRKRNPDKVREINRRYRERRALSSQAAPLESVTNTEER